MIIGKVNRERARRARKALFWCGSCDKAKVGSGSKCPACGVREPHKRNKS